MRLLVTCSFVLIAGAARAEEPVSLRVEGSPVGAFGTTARERDKARDTPDTAGLLEGLPGLRVRRLGGDGGFATFSIRGAASTQVGLVLAGVPLVGAADPTLDLSTLPLFPGAVARVYRSFAPGRLGGGYLGGLVQLDPLGLSRAVAETYLGAGSFGALRMRVGDVAKTGAWTFGAGLSASRFTGDFPYRSPFAERDELRANAGNAQVGALLAGRHDGDTSRTTLTALATTRRDGIAGTFEAPTFATRMARDRLLLSIQRRQSGVVFGGFARTEARTVEDPRGELGLGVKGTSHDRVYAFGGSAGFGLGAAPTSGFFLLDSTIEIARGVHVAGDPASRERARVGASFDGRAKLGPFSLAMTVRADVRGDRAELGSTQREVLPIGHAGIGLPIGEEVVFAAHLGSLARPPSFLELLGDGGTYLPSPKLASERAFTADLGLRVVTKSYELEVVAFGSYVKDLIVFVSQGLSTLRADNVGGAGVLGAEVSGAARVGALRVGATYTALLTRDLTTESASRGAALPGRPVHDLALDVGYTFRALTLRVGFDLVSSTTLDRAGLRVMPTRAYPSAGAKVALPGGLVLAAEVTNLFDQRTVTVPFVLGQPERRYPISDFQGYPLPGRRALVSLRFTR